MGNHKHIPELQAERHYRRLMSEVIDSGKSFRVSHVICEDIFQNSVIKALDNFDPGLGTFRNFVKVIYINKLKTFLTRDLFARMVILSGDMSADFDLIEEIDEPFVPDEFRSTEEFIFRLKAKLDDDERDFLNKLMEILPEVRKAIVSETARIMEMTPLKGWDVWRRIVRKADKLCKDNTQKKHDILYQRVDKRSDLFDLLHLHSDLRSKILDDLDSSAPPVFSFLTPAQAARLINILSKEF